MNEEYFIYHRNAFSRFLHSILNVHQRLMEQEATHLLTKKSRAFDPEVRALTARYNSDHKRSLILRRIIRGLESSLADNVERLNSCMKEIEQELIAENRSLRAALRRRNDELSRLNAIMEATYESIDARLSDQRKEQRVKPTRSSFRFGVSAAASFL